MYPENIRQIQSTIKKKPKQPQKNIKPQKNQNPPKPQDLH